jgi:Cu(I)/Ag(I) efflux system membrane fusion protein/cobalt-zinc-cadmium efflux system membrane fusion protein
MNTGYPISRRSHWTWAVVGLVTGVLVTVAVVISPMGRTLVPSRSEAGEQVRAADDGLWTCPMHPEVIQDEPGSCPICNMDLVPLEIEADATRSTVDAVWACPDHPDVIRESAPGECPIDGQPLVREASADHEGHANRQGAVVRLDPAVVQRMNVTTETVRRHDLDRTLRTVGYLAYDQERMVTVTTKYPGYVERLHVRTVGQEIAAGQPLFEVYAPELVQTQQDLLSAIEYARSLEQAPPETRQRAEALVDAAKARLSHWDIGQDQIHRLIETGRPTRVLTVRAPASGLVMQLMHGLEGMRIQPGMDVIHIADIDALWLNVEVFEDQLTWVGVGARAEVSFTAFPDRTYSGTVRYVAPEVSESTRTVQLTLQVRNPRGDLRVGMYATVVFHPTAVRDAIAVPTQSVLRTGQRSVVVIALGDGRFAPRDVELGVEVDRLVQITDGLDVGERIVTSAQFLIDSESNLREAIRRMSGAAGGDHAH